MTIPLNNQITGGHVMESASEGPVDLTQIVTGNYPMVSDSEAVVNGVLEMARKTEISLHLTGSLSET